MARVFTKLGKEITIAVKQGGPDVTGNPRLRALLQEARSENMPKENVERAIKRATDKDQGDYKAYNLPFFDLVRLLLNLFCQVCFQSFQSLEEQSGSE